MPLRCARASESRTAKGIDLSTFPNYAASRFICRTEQIDSENDRFVKTYLAWKDLPADDCPGLPRLRLCIQLFFAWRALNGGRVPCTALISYCSGSQSDHPAGERRDMARGTLPTTCRKKHWRTQSTLAPEHDNVFREGR